LLSALVGSTAVKAAAVIVAGLGVLGLLVVLAVNRTGLHRDAELHRRLSQRYCDQLKKRNEHSWSIAEWDELAVISTNGDTVQTITCTAVVECDVLDFFSIWAGPNWAGWPDRLRRKVKVKVRSRAIGEEGGTRSDMTSSWGARNRIEVVNHLREPAERGDVIAMEAELRWPARSLPLVRGDCPDEFLLSFPTRIDRAGYTVVMPRGYEVRYEAVGLDRGSDDYTVASTINNSGQCEISFEVRDLEGGRRVGLRLDLK
jgi:hypothetical protein